MTDENIDAPTNVGGGTYYFNQCENCRKHLAIPPGYNGDVECSICGNVQSVNPDEYNRNKFSKIRLNYDT